MEQKSYFAWVGGIVLAFALAMTLFILWIGKIDFGKEEYLYDIYFDGSVTGLGEGERVRFRGVPIGVVKSIKVSSQDLQHIQVTISVQDPGLIREDAVASLESAGITGIAYVQINGGSPKVPELKAKEGQRYPVIESQPSRLEEVFQQVPDVLSKIQKLAESLNEVLTPENKKTFKELLKSSNKMVQKLDESLTHFDSQFGKTTESLAKASEQADQTLKTIDGFLKRNQGAVEYFTQSILPEAGEFVGEGRETLQELGRLSKTLDSAINRIVESNSTGARRSVS